MALMMLNPAKQYYYIYWACSEHPEWGHLKSILVPKKSWEEAYTWVVNHVARKPYSDVKEGAFNYYISTSPEPDLNYKEHLGVTAWLVEDDPASDE
jgi:hypothetical protein